MLRYSAGNLLKAPVDALVNTVNEVGVMGKGIALMFKQAYPDASAEYEREAKAGRVKVGSVLAVPNHQLVGRRVASRTHRRPPINSLAYGMD
jgi:O-acetyl-ADP-ribose deacetylase (regulator of RNase III)